MTRAGPSAASRQACRRLVGALGLLLALPAIAAEPPPALRLDRPLGILTAGTLRLLFLDMPLLDARDGPASLEVRWEVANDWTLPSLLARRGRAVEVQLDEQADLLTLQAALPWARVVGPGPLADRVSTRLEWRVLGHWGGWTDRPIETWHRLAGLETFGRETAPRNSVGLHLGVPGGPRLFDLTEPRLAAGDLAVRTSARLAEGERAGLPWAVALRLDAKLPIGRPSQAASSGGFDAGVGLEVSGGIFPWLTGHGQATLRHVGPLPEALPLQPVPWGWSLEGSLVGTSGDWAFLLETRWLSALFPGGWWLAGDPQQGDALTAVTRAQNQISVGIRWRALTAWVAEDFTLGRRAEVGWMWFYDTNAPDLVVGVSVAMPL